MAIWTQRDTFTLDRGFVLAPERYHPGRALEVSHHSQAKILVGDVAELHNKVLVPSAATQFANSFLVFDTSDVNEGVVHRVKRISPADGIGSAKKIIRPGQVLISRLRPYLRQVGYVDHGLTDGAIDAEVVLLCSTEFFVLQSRNESSIAFLVPFLLSSKVQHVFSAATEGGHHPRFHGEVLLSLPIPPSLIEKREDLSRRVEAAAEELRRSETVIAEAISQAEACFETTEVSSLST